MSDDEKKPAAAGDYLVICRVQAEDKKNVVVQIVMSEDLARKIGGTLCLFLTGHLKNEAAEMSLHTIAHAIFSAGEGKDPPRSLFEKGGPCQN